MRLWSLHPRHLDPKGLVALWREALLARAVLRGETRGYTRHPQLQRFQAHAAPLRAIDAYLGAVHAEAVVRGYAFDAGKFEAVDAVDAIAVSDGQLDYEWRHLLDKLRLRSPPLFERWRLLAGPDVHPLFQRQPGPIADWERPHG